MCQRLVLYQMVLSDCPEIRSLRLVLAEKVQPRLLRPSRRVKPAAENLPWGQDLQTSVLSADIVLSSMHLHPCDSTG